MNSPSVTLTSLAPRSRIAITSIFMAIEVLAQRDLGATEVKVTEGLFTFVALDSNHQPRAVDAA